MPNTRFDYEAIHAQVLECIGVALRGEDFDALMKLCKPLLEGGETALEVDIKGTVDTAFKDHLQEFTKLLKPDCDFELYESLLNLAINAARNDLCTRNLPIMLLTDLFDCKTLAQCELLFALVEKRVDIWKEEPFFKSVKNQILRSCNDLLRRLSKSQNTVFCGRILVFLAKFFPLFERSGLNLISEFNQDNVTSISIQEEGVLTESMISDSSLEEGEMPTSDSIQVDYNLYRKFWQLQETFRHPLQFYNKGTWKQFQAYANDVVAAFNSFKLDSTTRSNFQVLNADNESDHVYFSKYLTNQKLLELQLSDSNFRRYILIQFVILFQYLLANVRFKQDTQSLSEEQNNWVKETNEKVMKLIEETPPNGIEMRKCVEHLLKREENWSNWKNDACPELKEINGEIPPKPMTKKRKLGDEVKAGVNANKIVIGNPELTKLWNLCPDNWEACRSKKRVFTPTVDKYFEEVVHLSEEERQKKIIEDSSYTWRALRLLSQKSSHFFTPSNQLVKAISSYLESVTEKLSKDFAAGGSKGGPDIAIDDAEDISDDELLKQVDESALNAGGDRTPLINNGNETPNGIAGVVNSAVIKDIAEKLKGDWKKAAPLLKIESDEIEYIDSIHKDSQVEQAKHMLTLWLERVDDPEVATTSYLQAIFTKALINITI
ncbi:THO complex subunit 1-like protein [Leptotrombidium deliense]|uniref:THO complex subunit 1-like protein n=1 Tax=Leptotrombidium deliense TaxID=299467 RepID=A0A443STS2_9ACAR|nr:THO complex subunit 1-like protein [Leptotrombidium deliense]